MTYPTCSGPSMGMAVTSMPPSRNVRLSRSKAWRRASPSWAGYPGTSDAISRSDLGRWSRSNTSTRSVRRSSLSTMGESVGGSTPTPGARVGSRGASRCERITRGRGPAHLRRSGVRRPLGVATCSLGWPSRWRRWPTPSPCGTSAHVGPADPAHPPPAPVPGGRARGPGPRADLAPGRPWPTHWSLTALVVQRIPADAGCGTTPAAGHAGPAPGDARTRPAPLDACLATLTRPVVAVATFTVVAVGTLVTPAVAAQASSPWWRALTDVALLLAGAVLWGPGAAPHPGRAPHRPRGGGGLSSSSRSSPRSRPSSTSSPATRCTTPSATCGWPWASRVWWTSSWPGWWPRWPRSRCCRAAWVALMRAQRVEDAAVDGDDGEPLTWAEVERQLDGRAGRGQGAHPDAAAPSVGDPRPAAPRADPVEPSPTDGPGSTDL